MRNGWNSRPNCRDATSDIGAEGRGEILYIDEQQLTRDCISHELERHLPELKVVGRATARGIDADDAPLGRLVVAVLYAHANRTDACTHQDTVDDEKIADELTLLEQLTGDVPRVLLSDIEMPEDIVSAFQRRIRGYVPTTLPIKQVAEAIRYVIAGGIFVPSSILSLSDRKSPSPREQAEPNPSTILANFSPRQNEVLRRLWRGSSNKMIAYELSMCESTVKVHIRHIMKKLNVSNRTQVVLHTRPLLLEDRQPADLQGQGRQPRSLGPAAGLTAIQSAVGPNGGSVVDTQDSRVRRNGSHHT